MPLTRSQSKLKENQRSITIDVRPSNPTEKKSKRMSRRNDFGNYSLEKNRNKQSIIQLIQIIQFFYFYFSELSKSITTIVDLHRPPRAATPTPSLSSLCTPKRRAPPRPRMPSSSRDETPPPRQSTPAPMSREPTPAPPKPTPPPCEPTQSIGQRIRSGMREMLLYYNSIAGFVASTYAIYRIFDWFFGDPNEFEMVMIRRL